MSTMRLLGGVTALALFLPCAQAAVVYDEAVLGDLSNIGTSPSFVSIASGSNVVRGTTGNPGSGADRDYFTVVVPAGMRLESLKVQPGTTVLGGLSFIGVQAGSQVTVNPTGGSPAGLLGWTHYSTTDIGNDILPRMGTGFGATGFSGALGAGNYSFWVQETAAGSSSYGFDLALAAVPEPAIALLFAMGLGGLALRASAARHPLPSR